MGTVYLITGGTGSLGRELCRQILAPGADVTVRVFSRDEAKQVAMAEDFGGEYGDGRMRFLIGDVRDYARLEEACHGVHVLIHAAALKRVEKAERDPGEFKKTNVDGTINVCRVARAQRVRKVLFISTDKAVNPITLYGTTKLMAECEVLASRNLVGDRPTRYAVMRYGNVMSSTGSVIPMWQRLARQGKPLPITDERMSRFWITLPAAARFVIDALRDMQDGEVFVPKIPSMRIVDLAEAIAPGWKRKRKRKIIGIRECEKLHEELLSAHVAYRTVEQRDRYVTLPDVDAYAKAVTRSGSRSLPDGFRYTSDGNSQWLSVEDMRALLAVKEAA